jgi:O-antigen ligase
MNLFQKRSTWPQFILSILPFTLFFPVGAMYAGIVIFFLVFLLSGDFQEKWRTAKASPLFAPALSLSAVSLFAALTLERPAHAFWSGFAHYQIYLFLLLFISVGAGEWQRRAAAAFFAGAMLAATFFYLNFLNLLPELSVFRSYLEYSGNKSILLGILLAIAAPWMLHDAIAHPERGPVWLRIFAVIYVAAALLLLAKTRTGALIFLLLCLLIGAKHMTLSWRAAGLFLAAILVLGVTFKFASGLSTRMENTVNDVTAFSQNKKISGQGIRLDIYRTTAQIIRERPVTGHGIGTWMSQFQRKVQGDPVEIQTTPHNDYLLYASEIGLLGVAALLWIWLAQLALAWRIGGDQGMWLGMLGVAIMVGGVFNAILRDALFGLSFMILLAIPLAGITRSKKEQE